MATGQRVLVVSRSESALAVLKEQLPEQVRPLAIAVLSNERQGLRQVENAIREIQTVTEGTSPQKRLAAIVRIENEIKELRLRVSGIDLDLENIAEAHLTKVGPRGETPADLAKRIVSERDAHRWFADRPARFTSESGIADLDVLAASEARRRIGELIDHVGVVLPAPTDLPDADTVAKWHEDLIAAAHHGDAARSGPARSLRVAQEDAYKALALAGTLDDLARAAQVIASASWAAPLWKSSVAGESNPWCQTLRDRLRELGETDQERATLLRRSVDLPPGVLDSDDAKAAIGRAASGQRLWPLVSVGKGDAKALVSAIKLDGSPPKDGDVEGWKHVAAVLANAMRQRETHARWDAFARSVGIPNGGQRSTAIEFCRSMLAACDAARAQSELLSSVVAKAFNLEALANNPSLCAALAAQIRAAASAARLATVDKERRRVRSLFESKGDRTSALVLQLLDEVIGSGDVQAGKVSGLWRGVLRRLEDLKARARDFQRLDLSRETFRRRPPWAKRVTGEKFGPDGDPVLPSNWRDAWDHAAADAYLARIDQRLRLTKLATEREAAEKQVRKLFGELVRERTFYELGRRLSPFVKAALVAFATALSNIPKSKGAKCAPSIRRAAREAMAKCYDAVPCWIMPTWRVAEQLPPEIGALDLVIIDEASQSDVTELPALLRGKKIIVVGDDRQVSPTKPFVVQEKIDQLRHHHLRGQPFNSLLDPGDSIYNLMRAVFPNERLMLKEHFRCVEPIIRFSMDFYPEKMLPLRIPAATERLDPPLVDIYLPHGSRARHRKVNEAEADVIVKEIASLAARPDMQKRTIGVISLIGAEQANLIRAKLSQTLGEEVMQRHAILCGDSATFQGTERDIVFLSMVADPAHKAALTHLKYEQRFNVAVSRARDRAVLVRSVKREELNPSDLKARLIAHFESPMPEVKITGDALDACESPFERDVMSQLLERGYRVQAQVGSLGYRIDMVAEGANGARLAIECDGDRYHGPDVWRQDMNRQRVLERVGWRFWRSFASSFYRDTEAVVQDLLDALSRMGIQPVPRDGGGTSLSRYTEHRVITLEPPAVAELAEAAEFDLGTAPPVAEPGYGIAVGDRVVLSLSDETRSRSVTIVEGRNDLDKGHLSVSSPLGKAVLGAEEGDEVSFRLDDGHERKVLIENVAKGAPISGATTGNAPTVTAV